jgi:hypothetical protein
MPHPYFRNIGNFEYVNRASDASRDAVDYVTVKNLFKRGKLREDIFQDLSVFEKYQIKGDDRPDHVAREFYNDPTLDWLILICNNITDVYSEWPMGNDIFNTYLLEKYDSYDILNDVHHYESNEVKDSQGVVIFPKGLRVDATQSVSYYDYYSDVQVNVSNVSRPVSNYEYEEKLNNDKRGIFILKPIYLNVVFDDLEEMMQYEEGSTQYVSETLKRADNPRLYQ